MGRRVAGVSSSLTPSAKSKLWKELRKLDRQIANEELDKRISLWGKYGGYNVDKLIERKKMLDQKRKIVRLKLKTSHL